MVSAPQYSISTMTADEVNESLARTNEHFRLGLEHLLAARREMRRVYESQGWESLGYKSWRAFAKDKYTFSLSQAYRLVKAAMIEADCSPVGEIDLPERTLRPLAPYDSNSRRLLLDFAQRWAEVNGVAVTPGVVVSVIDSIGELLVTGTWQDSEGAQRDLFEKMDADLTARVTETKMRQKGHFTPRSYVVRNAPVKTYVIRGQALTLPPIQIEAELQALLDQHQGLRIAVWVDE